MKLICTFPGRYGDLLWALPTIRAISRRVGEPVDLLIAGAFQSITPLLRQQPYLASVEAVRWWVTQDTAPITPRIPLSPPSNGDYDYFLSYDRIVHLGYRAWPLPDVLLHTRDTAELQLDTQIAIPELKLDEPWITLPAWLQGRHDLHQSPWICGFTDEYFELKYGVWTILNAEYTKRIARSRPPANISTGPRWRTEGGFAGADWLVGAQCLNHTSALLTDCSAWHVLAVAMGISVVMLEPQAMRHNEVFYPFGKATDRVRLVVGVDGHPTWDARHVADALERIMLLRKEQQV